MSVGASRVNPTHTAFRYIAALPDIVDFGFLRQRQKEFEAAQGDSLSLADRHVCRSLVELAGCKGVAFWWPEKVAAHAGVHVSSARRFLERHGKAFQELVCPLLFDKRHALFRRWFLVVQQAASLLCELSSRWREKAVKAAKYLKTNVFFEQLAHDLSVVIRSNNSSSSAAPKRPCAGTLSKAEFSSKTLERFGFGHLVAKGGSAGSDFSMNGADGS